MLELGKENLDGEYPEPHWDLLDEQLRRAFNWLHTTDGDMFGGNDFIALQAICLCRAMILPKSYDQIKLAKDFLWHVYHTAEFIDLAAGNAEKGSDNDKLSEGAKILRSLGKIFEETASQSKPDA